ncbi:MAG: hypothetical protein P8Z79_15525 [Sedimentisphaerales bacterium]
MWVFQKRILKSAIENWLVSLFTAVGVAIGGWSLWLYRSHLKDWLLSARSVEMLGWVWVALVLIVGSLPISVFCLYKKMKQRVLFHEDEEMLVVLEHRLGKYGGQKQNEILIDFRECDRKWGFPNGSAQRLLPDVVEKDKRWKIKDKSGNAMTIIRDDPRVTVAKKAFELNQ